ncbi:MAG TPA: glycosyltransferase 87 family protein [Solirubrobacteraceae bacterium]
MALRANALCVLAAAAGTATLAWLGLTGFVWSDYELEVLPAFTALVHGHVAQFLRLTPAYGGSLVLRAPFALLPGLWGGGQVAVYRTVALPCLLAAAALGVWLVADMRRRGLPGLARGVVLALCVANPLTLSALEVGHPEELLGGALCVAAVLLAARGRTLWAALLLGAAIANKEWALLALAPVLLALPQRRTLCALATAGVAGAILAPPLLVHAGSFLAATRATGTPSSAIFQPWQVWWFLGHHGAVVRGTFGRIKPGYRTGPAWTGLVSHPLVLATMLPLGALLWRRQRSAPASARAALLLLALLMLLRCALDTWDTAYYTLPFLLALTAWESQGPRGLPALALASTALVWVDFEWLRYHASPDVQAACFLLWTLPLAAALALELYAPGALRTRARSLGATLAALRRRPSAPWAAR